MLVSVVRGAAFENFLRAQIGEAASSENVDLRWRDMHGSGNGSVVVAVCNGIDEGFAENHGIDGVGFFSLCRTVVGHFHSDEIGCLQRFHAVGEKPQDGSGNSCGGNQVQFPVVTKGDDDGVVGVLIGAKKGEVGVALFACDPKAVQEVFFGIEIEVCLPEEVLKDIECEVLFG